MGHLRRVLDQRLDRPEGFGQREQTGAAGDVESRRLASPERERDHRSEVEHLPRRQRVTGMLGEPGVVDLSHGWMGEEVHRDQACVRALAVEPHGESLQSALDEITVEWARHRTCRVLDESEVCRQLLVARGDQPADHVRVSPQVLRRRVDHSVGAETDRLLEVRGRERVVDDAACSLRVARLRRPPRCR